MKSSVVVISSGMIKVDGTDKPNHFIWNDTQPLEYRSLSAPQWCSNWDSSLEGTNKFDRPICD